MRFRPGTPVTAEGVQGEGLVVVDPGTGRAGAPLRHDRPGRGPDHPDDGGRRPGAGAQHRPGRPVTRAPGRRERARSPTATRSLPRSPRQLPPPTVWCSWYRYFEEVTADDVLEDRARPRRARPRRRRGAGRRRVEPGPRRGAAARGAVRVAGAAWWTRCGPSGRRAGIWLAPFLVGDGHHPGPRAPRLAGRTGRPELGTATSVGLDLTHPGVQELLVDALQRSRRPGRRLPQARLPVRRRGARPAPRGRRPGSRLPGGPRRWCATWSDPTSTWWAAARRSCRASAWSTPCGSPRTPSTRAARTARPGCAG